LDYFSLMSENSHSAELDRTVKNLAQCLSVIEAGLNTMLDKTIEEEDDDEFGDSAHDGLLDANLLQFHNT